MLSKTATSLAGALALLIAASGALAQSQAPGSTQATNGTSTGTTSTTTTPSPYESLSPGNQKIVRALYEAQQTTQPPAGTEGAPSATNPSGTSTEPLTLDEIAAMKQSGQGWGQVFKEMKAQGLVQEKNLGQAVSQYHRKHPAQISGTETTVTTASGRQYRYGSASSGKGSPGTEHGAAERGQGHGTNSQYSSSGHGSRGATYTAGGVSHGNSGTQGGGSGHGNGGKK